MFSRKSGQVKEIILGYTVGIIIALAICGWIGSWLWPYTINTWAGYAKNNPDIKVISKGQGFWLGVIPFAGQVMVPAAVVTCCCDLIFIPDEVVKTTEENIQ